MTEESRALAVAAEPVPHGRAVSLFSSPQAFEQGQRIAGALVASDLVPTQYRGRDNLPNAMIALDMSNRMGIPAVMVMQNLHVIEGRPSWGSSFILAALNACGLFSPIRFKVERVGEVEATYDKWEGPKGERRKVSAKLKVREMRCIAWATEKDTGEILEGPEVSISMAVAEGWYTRPGSKWVTMPDLMIRYRAAAFFGRLYAPHILNGMSSVDEAEDIADMRDVTPKAPEPAQAEPKPEGRASGVHAAMARGKVDKPAKPKPATIEGEAKAAKKAEPEPEREPDPNVDDVFDADEDGEFGPV